MACIMTDLYFSDSMEAFKALFGISPDEQPKFYGYDGDYDEETEDS